MRGEFRNGFKNRVHFFWLTVENNKEVAFDHKVSVI